MTVLSLSNLKKTGLVVSDDMFGANAVFQTTDAGAPTDAYEAAAEVLGVQNIRFGGGQADLDPTKANAAGELPIDGFSAINIVDMPGGQLRPELVTFLEWCLTQNAAGHPTQATLVIPTKHLSAEDYQAFGAEIEVFAQAVMAQYGEVISAFQMGNEYWEMGETAYGIKASIGAEALARGMEAAGYATEAQPDILVQMATPGNAGSEFPAISGVSNFAARTIDANQQIIDQLSDAARAAIDGVTEHYYYSETSFELEEQDGNIRNIARDYETWSGNFDKELDLHITEWNVKTTATQQHGIVAASSLINQFENMIELGVDGAHVWTFDYHSRTALTLVSDEGPRLDEAGRLTNSAQGAAFDLMSGSLRGAELVEAFFSGGVPGIEISAYATETAMIFYIYSRNTDTTSFTVDLSAKLPNRSVEGVKIAMDADTANGKQWLNGEDAERIEIDGGAYFYNEHDVDVTLTDLLFDNASEIDLMLNPFEVVELTLDLDVNVDVDLDINLGGIPIAVEDPPVDTPDDDVTDDAPVQDEDPKEEPDDDITDDEPSEPTGELITSDKHYILGTSVDDLIEWTDNVVYVDAGDGLDTVFVDAIGESAIFKIDGLGKPVMTLTDTGAEVTLNNVERIVFNDGVLAADVEGNAGQAYRLYEASFNRTPDEAGLEFWVKQLDSGDFTLVEIADHFLTSEEFQETYGKKDELTDNAYLDLLYQNVLDRDPDQAGYKFWSDQQANDFSREEMLVHFSESAENKANVAPAIDDGIWYG